MACILGEIKRLCLVLYVGSKTLVPNDVFWENRQVCLVAMAKNVVFAMKLAKENIVDPRASFVKYVDKCMEEAPTVKP